MANFPGLQMTAAGRDLQAKAQTGVPLNFSRVAIGDGENPVDYEPLVNLVSEKKSLDLAGFELLGDGTSKLKVLLTNEGVAEGFFIREIGVFAIDPDTSTEILYSYSNADQYIDYLPAFGGATIVEMTFDLYTVVGNATTVTATINEYLVHATKADVDELRPYVLPPDGLVDQQMRKASNAEGDYEWFDPAEGIQIRINSVTEERTAVQGQTAFALTKTLTNGLAVYVNGLRLSDNKWSAVGATQVLLSDALVDGDKVQFVNNEEVGTASLSRVSLDGPDLVFPETTNSYTITDYDRFSVYEVTTNIGTTSHADGVITLDVPPDAVAPDGGILMTVQRNSGSMSFRIALGAGMVARPEITSPQNNATNVGETPTFTASAFQTYPSNSDTHIASTWRVATDEAMTNVIWQSVDDPVNLTAITLPEDILSLSTDFYVDVGFAGSAFGVSSKSAASKFTTAGFFDSEIGDPIAGGYFAGYMNPPDGPRYALIMSPKSSGEGDELPFKTENSEDFESFSYWNGLSNSQKLNDSAHPAVQFCMSLVIAGYSDWYLPARDEMELLYRNFKPGNASNEVGDRVSARSGQGYYGENDNSEPKGAAYTSANPQQTTIEPFASGIDGLKSGNYFATSTQSPNADRCIYQYGWNGRQVGSSKTYPYVVRAVRRILLD